MNMFSLSQLVYVPLLVCKVAAESPGKVYKLNRVLIHLSKGGLDMSIYSAVLELE